MGWRTLGTCGWLLWFGTSAFAAQPVCTGPDDDCDADGILDADDGCPWVFGQAGQSTIVPGVDDFCVEAGPNTAELDDVAFGHGVWLSQASLLRIGRNAIIGDYAVLGGASEALFVAPHVIVAGASSPNHATRLQSGVVSRTAEVGVDVVSPGSPLEGGVTSGDDLSTGRSSSIGYDVTLGDRVSIGYVSAIGHGTSVGSDTIIGSLVELGANGWVGSNVVVARSVGVGDDFGFSSGTVIGPEVVMGDGVELGATALGDEFGSGIRIRKRAILNDGARVEENVRIGRSVTIGAGATVGADSRLAANVDIAAGAVLEPDSYLRRDTRIACFADNTVHVVESDGVWAESNVVDCDMSSSNPLDVITGPVDSLLSKSDIMTAAGLSGSAQLGAPSNLTGGTAVPLSGQASSAMFAAYYPEWQWAYLNTDTASCASDPSCQEIYALLGDNGEVFSTLDAIDYDYQASTLVCSYGASLLIPCKALPSELAGQDLSGIFVGPANGVSALTFDIPVTEGDTTVDVQVTVTIDNAVPQSPPVATGARYATTLFGGRVVMSELLDSTTDTDGHTFSGTGIANITGGTAFVEGNSVVVNAASYPATVSFDLEVTDSWGGTGTVSVDVPVEQGGNIVTWGNYALDSSGTGGRGPMQRPTPIAAGGNITTTGIGRYTSCFGAPNEVWCVGGGYTTLPTVAFSGHTFETVETGEGAGSCGRKSSGEVWCWGSGSGTDAFILGPTPASGDPRTTPSQIPGNYTKMSVGGSSSACAINASQQLQCWGRNQFGNLGIGGSSNTATPTTVSGGGAWTDVSLGGNLSCGLRTDGKIWCWSGIMDDIIRTAPAPVLMPGQSGHTFDRVFAGGYYHFCGLKSDGSAWCWGEANGGKLGNGDGSNITMQSPQQVLGGHAFVELALNRNTSCGRKANGEVWCWGSDSGNGNTGTGPQAGDVLTPQQIAGLYATQIHGHEGAFVALQ